MSKQSVSLSLSEKNIYWLDQNGYNRSGYVDDLLTKARTGHSEAEQVVARYREEQLEMERTKLESQLEGVEEQLSDVRDRVQTEERRKQEKLNEALEAIDKVPSKHLDEQNQAVINQAEKVGLTPEELLDEYHD